MATHSSVLAWRIPGTGEPGGLPSLGSHRVGHDLSDLAVYVLIKFGYKASVPNEISFSHFFVVGQMYMYLKRNSIIA